MNKQQLEEIINNAPEIEGVVFDGRYFKYADGIWLVYTGGCPDYEECAFHDSPMPDASRVRKISDLQTQLNQLNESERLKSKIDELEKENAELKAHVNQQQTNLDRLWHLAEDLGACSEYLKVNFASGSYIPKQSLAQHDKEVIESFVKECKNSDKLTGIEKLTTENAELEKAKLNQYVRVGFTNYYQLHYMMPNDFSQDAFQNDDDSGNVFQTKEDGDFEVYVTTTTWNKYQEQLQEQS